jgi:hypothetical protein
VDFHENKVLYFIFSVPTWYGSDVVGHEGVSIDDRRCSMATKGLFGLGDIPKWLGVATENVVATRLVYRM